MPTSDESKAKKERLEITAEPNKVLPKLVTKIGITKADSGNVILSFIFELPDEGAHLVERIIIDSNTSAELVKLLKQAEGIHDEQ